MAENLENLLLIADQWVAKYSEADMSLKEYYFQVLYKILAKSVANSKLK